MPYQDHFDLDLTRAIREQLVEAFDNLHTLPLDEVPPLGTAEITTQRGVYGLFLKDGHSERLVYVGKADNLRKRLGDHAYKISGRQNITPADVACKCLSVNRNWASYAPESILMNHFGGMGHCEWNGNGFGPHDPGRNREETNKPPDGFDQQYPIRYNLPCPWVTAGRHEVLDLLLLMKANLPYLLRFQSENRHRHREGHRDFNGQTVEIPTAGMPADQIMRLIAEAMPGWQATRFPSHMIFYRENREYTHGIVMGRGDES